MPLVTRNSNSSSHFKGTTAQESTQTMNEGDTYYNTQTDILKSYDGSALNQVGRTSFAAAAVISHSTTIGDYTAPSAGAASSSGTLTPTFDEAYTTNTGWTAVGSNVTIDSGVADACAAVAATCNADNRVHKSLGATLSDTLWALESDIILSSSAGNDNMPYSLCAGTGTPDTASQDCIVAYWDTSADTMRISYKDGAGAFSNATGNTISVVESTQYYIRMIRNSATNIALSIFSDSGRTTHITGSPQNYTIPSTVGGLTHIHHGTRSVGSAQTTTFTIDNTKINNNASYTAYSAGLVVDDDTASHWQSSAEANPRIYVDAGSAKNLLGLAIYLHANNTETQIAIRCSTDATFTSGENVRTILASGLTAGSWNYVRFNLVNRRYIQIYGNSGSSLVLAISEVKYLTKTDAQILQDLGILEISTSDTSLDLDGT